MSMPAAPTNRVDLAALPLAAGERAEFVSIDQATGDYRVFHVGIETAAEGSATLTFELHRQDPGLVRLVFNALSMTLGPVGTDGLCAIEAFTCDAGLDSHDLLRLLPRLTEIVALLQKRKRPADALVLPFLSRRAQILWTQALVKGVAS